MTLVDLHTHSTFCDGKNTPEEMVLAAIARGIDTLGIVVHSYMSFDEGYCVKRGGEGEFISEMERLKKKYEGKIKLLCGMERDVYSDSVVSGYDYVIGSAHYLKIGGEYYPVDAGEESLTRTCREHFGGDFIALAEAYYETLSMLPELFTPDIIGHLDLVTKYNEGDRLFDTASERYQRAARSAVDALVPLGVPFEINTGAIARGYRITPYPSPQLIEYLKERGARLILSSDAHKAESLAGKFEEFSILL